MVLILAPTASATYTDVSLAVTAPARVSHGDQFDYSVSVHNRGSHYTATNVVIRSELPAGLQLDGSTLGCTQEGADLTCELGTIGKSSQKDGTITVTANETGDAVF